MSIFSRILESFDSIRAVLGVSLEDFSFEHIGLEEDYEAGGYDSYEVHPCSKGHAYDGCGPDACCCGESCDPVVFDED